MLLDCCNAYFESYFSYVLTCTSTLYRKIIFGRCPNCGNYVFKEYRQFENGLEDLKVLRGKAAQDRINRWTQKLKNQKSGSLSNQNYYYGDFKKTGRKDSNGNPIYVQLRRNFNGQSEILNTITTKHISLV